MEPDPPELNARLGAVWKFARELDGRIEAIETWRTTQESLAAWRRWVLPIVLTIIFGIFTILNVFLPHRP